MFKLSKAFRLVNEKGMKYVLKVAYSKVTGKHVNQECRLAHKYLDSLQGIEIGGSAHNSFGLNTKNVDYTDDMTTIYKLEEKKVRESHEGGYRSAR